MSSPVLPTPLSQPDQLAPLLREQGYAVIDLPALSQWLSVPKSALKNLTPYWDNLPPDQYLRDGGHYRKRRHSCFVAEDGQVSLVPHRAHWQPVDYNALHGGIERWFDPIDPKMVAQPVWTRLLEKLATLASTLKGAQRWYIEAHPFRIDTTEGIGRPTPEGAHRDGVDLVAVVLIDRKQIKGGETRVFEANGPKGLRFTLSEPWTMLLLDDARVIHESTPIQPLHAEETQSAHRDTLVITLRAGSFQQA